MTFFLSKQHSLHILPYHLQNRHSSSSALLSVALSLAVAERNRTSQQCYDTCTTASSIDHVITIQNSVFPACYSFYLTFTKWKCLSPLIETFAIGWIEQLLKSSNWHGYECFKKFWNLEYNINVFFANSPGMLAHGSWGNSASQVFQRREAQEHFKSTSLESQQRPLQQCTLELSL